MNVWSFSRYQLTKYRAKLENVEYFLYSVQSTIYIAIFVDTH